MGPLQENHSHNGPKKRRKLPPASPTQRTGPQASAGLSDPTDSPGRAHPIGIRRPFRPNGLARQGTPHRYPPAFPPQRTRPAGHTPEVSAGLSAPTDSPGRAHPIGIRRPFRPNRLARQGTLHRHPPAIPLQRTRPEGHPRRHPPAFPPQRTRPVGQASQTSAGRSRRNQLKSVFSGDMRPGKNTSQPSSVRPPKGPCMQRAATPNFGRGHGPGRQPDTPASPASRTKRNRSSPLPKFKTPRFQPFSDGAARPGCWRCR